MPRGKPKAFEAVEACIRDAIIKALQQPGSVQFIATEITIERTRNLQAKIAGMKTGILQYEGKGTELYLAIVNKRFAFRSEPSPYSPNRNLVVKYLGRIQRPSEIAAEYLEELLQNPQALPKID